MVSEFAGNLPILGAEQSKVRSTPQFLVSFVRSLDENGTFEPESTFLNNGQVQAIAGRSNICSAEDLVDLVCDALIPRIKTVIREELAYQRTKDREAITAEQARRDKLVESMYSSGP